LAPKGVKLKGATGAKRLASDPDRTHSHSIIIAPLNPIVKYEIFLILALTFVCLYPTLKIMGEEAAIRGPRDGPPVATIYRETVMFDVEGRNLKDAERRVCERVWEVFQEAYERALRLGRGRLETLSDLREELEAALPYGPDDV
jgi:hypothetical protein